MIPTYQCHKCGAKFFSLAGFTDHTSRCRPVFV